MNSPRALFVEANTSGSGFEFLNRARDLGLAPVFLTDRPSRYGFLRDPDGIDIRICDTSSMTAVTACVDAVAATAPIALILSTSDYFVEMAAAQAARLDLPGPFPDAVALCRDKARQAEALLAAGVGFPSRSFTIGSLADVPDAVAAVGLPAVLKPVSGTGSIGVSLVASEADLVTAVTAILAITVNARCQPVTPRALLMAYVAGDEYSVEMLDSTVIGVTKKYLGALPFFVEIGHDFPAPIPPDLWHRISAEATRAISAAGHTRGPAHVELRATPTDITIIEINPRLAGGSIPSLVRHASGVDLVAAVLDSARGRAPATRPTRAGHGALRFVIPEGDGLFLPPVPTSEVAKHFGLAEIMLYHPLPIAFRRSNDFRDRVGHVIAVDADPAAAAQRAEAAIAELCRT